MKKEVQNILDSRHIKIISVKKKEFKNSVVFISLDEDKFGLYDVAQLRKLAETLDSIEPDGCYFLGLKQFKIEIYDKAAIKNRDLIITVSHNGDDSSDVSPEDVEARLKQAFSEARSIQFVHVDAVVDYRI